MNKKDKNIELMQVLIKEGNLPKIKKLVKNGIDIHHANDYFLYLSVFAKNQELQRYFIDIGLNPEVTKGRMAMAHPQGLEYIRQYKYETQVKAFAEELVNELNSNHHQEKKLKI